MLEPLAMAASTRRSEDEEEGAVEVEEGAAEVRGGRWDEGKARGVTGVGRR